MDRLPIKITAVIKDEHGTIHCQERENGVVVRKWRGINETYNPNRTREVEPTYIVIDTVNSSANEKESIQIFFNDITIIGDPTNGEVDVSNESGEQIHNRIYDFFGKAPSPAGGGAGTGGTTTTTVDEQKFTFHKIENNGDLEYIGYEIEGAATNFIKRLTYTTTTGADGVPVVSVVVEVADKDFANYQETTGWRAAA